MLDLNAQEMVLLKEILREVRQELMTEINRTDSLEYKQSLKERRRLLDNILARFGTHASAQPMVEEVPGQAHRL